MIVCLVGTSPYSFDRLVKKIDEKIAIENEVFLQLGNTTYKPKNCKFTEFVEKNKLIEMMKSANLVIAQGGYGSMMDAIQLEKKVIAIPREEQYKELIGDQSELVKYFESKKYVIGCYEIDDLEKLVQECLENKYEFNKYIPESNHKISQMIEAFINEL